MAEQNIGLNTKCLIAGQDLSSYQYRFVKVSTAADRTCLLGSLNCEVAGVLQNKPKIGEMALIATGPQPKVVAGDVIADGDDLICDANGCAIPKGATGTPNIAGRAITTAAAGIQSDLTYEVVQFDSKISGQ